MPLITGLCPPPAQLVRVVLAKCAAPLPDRLIREDDPARCQQFFYVAIAEGESIIEPHGLTDNLGREGVAKLEFNLLDALAVDGVYMLTGIPGGERPINIPGADLIRQLVLGNQAMVGSVNAARDHFQMAVADLAVADKRWPGHTAHLITGRYSTANFADAFAKPAPDEIKAVVEWVA